MHRWCRREELFFLKKCSKKWEVTRRDVFWCPLAGVVEARNSGWLACRSAQGGTAAGEANCLLCFCCRTPRPPCLNRKMTLALGSCVLSNWHTNTPWAETQICINVMNQSHFASCRLLARIYCGCVWCQHSKSGQRAYHGFVVCACEAAGTSGKGRGRQTATMQSAAEVGKKKPQRQHWEVAAFPRALQCFAHKCCHSFFFNSRVCQNIHEEHKTSSTSFRANRCSDVFSSLLRKPGAELLSKTNTVQLWALTSQFQEGGTCRDDFFFPPLHR